MAGAYKRAIRDILDNRFLNAVTVITIALSILIVSAFALLFINVNDLMHSWRDSLRVMVYLKSDVAVAELSDVEQKIRLMPNIKAVHFVSKEDALAQLKSQMPGQASLFQNLKENPLPDAFEIRVQPDADVNQKITYLVGELKRFPWVEQIEYGQRWLGKFTNIFNLFRISGYAAGCLFLMAAVFIVANTIRLVIYARRDEVEIMRLVGAADNFIKAPFYVEGVIQGALGGFIGLAVCLGLFFFISSKMDQGLTAEILQVRFLPVWVWLAVWFASITVGWLGCFISLKQYLKN